MFRVVYFALAAAAWCVPGHASVLKVENARVATIGVVVNGQPLRLRIDPAANGDVTLNPDAARRARLRPSMVLVKGMIGPVEVRGRSAKSAIEIGGASARATFTWYDRPITPDADGIISPGILPYDEVHLQLGPSRRGETRTDIPVHFSKDYGIAQAQSIAGTRLLVRFSIGRRQSISTAAAGAILSSQFGGSWAGAVTPFMMQLGVERPVRPLRLSKSWLAGAFPIKTFLVRVNDWRGGHALPPDTQYDPGEIVVTAKSRGSQKPFYEFVVGHDRIGGCSSVIYTKAKKLLRFTC